MELAEYVLETLRRDGEFLLYRGQHRRHTDASPPSILALTPVLERPALASLRRMEHEYSFKAELDPAWAVRPLALASHEGRTMLVLTDPGGEPLERLLGKPTAMPQFLHLAVGLSAALSQMHRRGLVHKDLKPANILVNRASGEAWLTGFGIASRLPRVAGSVASRLLPLTVGALGETKGDRRRAAPSSASQACGARSRRGGLGRRGGGAGGGKVLWNAYPPCNRCA